MTKSLRPEGEGQSRLSRRTLFAGATTVGALAAAATVLPRVSEPAPAAETQPAPTKGGGYSLTAHVKQYYQTTRL